MSVKSCCITPRSRPQVGKRSIRRTSFPDSGDQKRVVVSRMVAAAEPAKPVVELGSFSILNPKPPGQVVSGDFSVDSGNAATGAKLFKAKCASCHTIKEGGAPCGPSWAAYRRGRVGSGRGGARASGMVTRVLGLTAHRWRRCVHRPEHARAESARDHGTSGWEGAPSQRHGPKCAMHPTPSLCDRSEAGRSTPRA